MDCNLEQPKVFPLSMEISDIQMRDVKICLVRVTETQSRFRVLMDLCPFLGLLAEVDATKTQEQRVLFLGGPQLV